MGKVKLAGSVSLRISPELEEALKKVLPQTYLTRSEFIRAAIIEKIHRLDGNKNQV